MVYCGKPSKGCSNCRERKIRCDQREPDCGQCQKRQHKCPGYRNLVDLMFRDESSHVIKKAKAKSKLEAAGPTGLPPEALPVPGSPGAVERSHRPRRRSSLSLLSPSLARRPGHSGSLRFSRLREQDGLLPSPDDGGSCWPSTPMLALRYALSPTFLERGTAYFFSRYVATDEYACHQRFDFIYDVWKPASAPPSPQHHQVDSVVASITAVGLVGLANMTGSREVMESARKSYGTALRLINTALKVPDEVVKDTTMLSILILGLFEMIADTDGARTVKAWQEHVNGAAALAKLRGVAQFRTRAGTKMFMMLCQTAMISCIQQGLPMPQALVDLRAALSRQLRNSPESCIEVSMPIYRVLQFRYEVQSGRLGTPEAAIDRLIEMDDEFEHVVTSFPASWRYRVLRLCQPHREVFDGVCHVYPTMAKAAVWNGIRSCRLLILETILTEMHGRFRHVHSAQVPLRYIEAFARARTRILDLCLAILASIPQLSGLVTATDGYGGQEHTVDPISTIEVRAPATSPQSPESTSPSSSSSSSGPTSTSHSTWTALPSENKDIGVTRGRIVDDSGPTLLDPTRSSKNTDQETHRLMLLASAGNTIVWPLYHAGMSSACSPAMKAYCIERLEALYRESGLRQASAIASIMRDRVVLPRWMELPLAK